MRRFLREFETAVIRRYPVLPTADFLTISGYTASAADIEDLVARLCEQMLVDRAGFTLELFDGTPAPAP